MNNISLRRLERAWYVMAMDFNNTVRRLAEEVRNANKLKEYRDCLEKNFQAMCSKRLEADGKAAQLTAELKQMKVDLESYKNCHAIPVDNQALRCEVQHFKDTCMKFKAEKESLTAEVERLRDALKDTIGRLSYYVVIPNPKNKPYVECQLCGISSDEDCVIHRDECPCSSDILTPPTADTPEPKLECDCYKSSIEGDTDSNVNCPRCVYWEDCLIGEKPTPPTFKVGDRVRMRDGSKGKVVKIETNCYVGDENRVVWVVPTDSLSLIEPTPPTAEEPDDECSCLDCVHIGDKIEGSEWYQCKYVPDPALDPCCAVPACNAMYCQVYERKPEPTVEEPKPAPKLRVVDGNRLMYGDVEVKEYTHWDNDTPPLKVRTHIEHLMNPGEHTDHYIIVNGERIKVDSSMFEPAMPGEAE